MKNIALVLMAGLLFLGCGTSQDETLRESLSSLHQPSAAMAATQWL